MTIGISKEKLIEIIEDWSPNDRAKVYDKIISQCTELNPWNPIESAPKDRRIIMYCSLHKTAYTAWWAEDCYMYDVGDLPSPVAEPAFWQELPADPD